MNDRKEELTFNTIVSILVGVFTIFIIIYTWKYKFLNPGWRFLGMVFISLIVGVAMQVLMMIFNKWLSSILEKKRISDICRTIDIPENCSEPEDITKLWRHMVTRYSPDLLVNRLSDVIGIIVTTGNFIISIGITISYFGMIALCYWYSDYSEPSILWITLFLHLSLLLCVWLIYVICNVLFNRYPGEAKRINHKYDEIRKTDAFLSNKDFSDSIHG